ncbi:hypothetical protein EV426DRAFT_706592 [Tirmania nivea]|nr:hypothetical protein EV426DRAFT_706592 [Tirmania nivea]
MPNQRKRKIRIEIMDLWKTKEPFTGHPSPLPHLTTTTSEEFRRVVSETLGGTDWEGTWRRTSVVYKLEAEEQTARKQPLGIPKPTFGMLNKQPEDSQAAIASVKKAGKRVKARTEDTRKLVEALRGLTYVVTDRGPQRWWLHKIGRADDPRCGLCEEGVAQNAAHLLSCPGVADGKGRKWEQIWEDPEWCEKLAGAVRG